MSMCVWLGVFIVVLESRLGLVCVRTVFFVGRVLFIGEGVVLAFWF